MGINMPEWVGSAPLFLAVFVFFRFFFSTASFDHLLFGSLTNRGTLIDIAPFNVSITQSFEFRGTSHVFLSSCLENYLPPSPNYLWLSPNHQEVLSKLNISKRWMLPFERYVQHVFSKFPSHFLVYQY